MSSSNRERGTADAVAWTIPVVPGAYERYPLTNQEKEALKDYLAARVASAERAACRQILHRLIQPVKDLWKLRHPTDVGKKSRSAVIAFLIGEMDTRQAAFWQWSMDDWVEVLSTRERKPVYFTTRPTLIDLAYLLCGFDRLYAIGRLDTDSYDGLLMFKVFVAIKSALFIRDFASRAGRIPREARFSCNKNYQYVLPLI